MPMMMHHDSQPLYTPGSPYGLINQASILRNAGAISLQVLMMTPATGSKLYEGTYDSGMVYRAVGKRNVEPYMLDGNYVVASKHEKPWKKQANILLAYLYFYNPIRFLVSLVRPKSRLFLADAGMQIIGMFGLLQTIRRTIGWALRLVSGKVERHTTTPFSRIPMRGVATTMADHALPGTPTANLVQLTARTRA